MAIVMVRKPSDTPNVRNIDDIIPFRYAYFNQNGYIKNKSNELNYEIDGLNFKIKSGRVVFQGVESDVDAAGITITIDNTPYPHYYVVYYNVNLALNTTSIEYDYHMGGYPIVDEGDDLIANTSGYANFELYRFVAQNGIISNVEKLVQPIDPIEYVKNLEIYNSLHSNQSDNSTISENSKLINNLNIKLDSNGVLKCGDLIIPQQKVLWEGKVNIYNDGGWTEIGTYSENLRNKRLVIEYKMESSVYGSTALNKTDVFMVDDYIQSRTIEDRSYSSGSSSGYISFKIDTSGTNNTIKGSVVFVVEGSSYVTPVYVTRVYEIIE